MSVAASSRQGAGGKLVRTLLAWASGLTLVGKVTLGTLNVKVAAIRLYERYGFELVSSTGMGARLRIRLGDLGTLQGRLQAP